MSHSWRKANPGSSNPTGANPKAYPCCPSLKNFSRTHLLGCSSHATTPGGHMPRELLSHLLSLPLVALAGALHTLSGSRWGCNGDAQPPALLSAPRPGLQVHLEGISTPAASSSIQQLLLSSLFSHVHAVVFMKNESKCPYRAQGG